MKSLFLIALLGKLLHYAHYNQHEREPFFFLKCIFYFFVSSIHSLVVNVPIPLGACLMFLLSLFETKNRPIKLKMIGLGLLVIVLSFLNYKSFAYPFQKLYLYCATHDVQKIEVYAHTPEFDDFLFNVTEPDDLKDWISSLQSSIPHTSWSNKILPNDTGYSLKLYLSEDTIDVFISSSSNKDSNLFVGNKLVAYSNATLLNLISTLHPDTPSVLTINSTKSTSINITNSTLLNNLWRNVVWSQKQPLSNYSQDIFSVPAYLFFDDTLGCKLFFTTNFDYAYIYNKGVIPLSSYLQSMLSEQFILSQLDPVEELDTFDPAHIYNIPENYVNYSIDLDDNKSFYGLYYNDYSKNETTLLHTVNSRDAKYFILRSPYILLLDKKTESQYYLMLVNQNIPEKHRYIEKNQNVIPHSVSICPQNIKFTYIIENQDNSVLYLVNNYYQSPTPIATGTITDSLFLSDDYIVFTQELDGQNLLCMYSINYSKVIKYILIPGTVTLVEGSNNKVYFSVQKFDNLSLKQGIFYIDTTLNIQKSDKDFAN